MTVSPHFKAHKHPENISFCGILLNNEDSKRKTNCVLSGFNLSDMYAILDLIDMIHCTASAL